MYVERIVTGDWQIGDTKMVNRNAKPIQSLSKLLQSAPNVNNPGDRCYTASYLIALA
jgi:hypothetical protein